MRDGEAREIEYEQDAMVSDEVLVGNGEYAQGKRDYEERA